MGELALSEWYESDAFKTLQKKWYQKLKSSGFDDAENDKEFLREWHARYFFIRHTPEAVEQRLTYFNSASEFYWQYQGFKSIKEKEIWRLHSEGFSRREIAKEVKLHASKVQRILLKLKNILHSGLWSSREGTEHRNEDS